jgi:hypothetical protein
MTRTSGFHGRTWTTSLVSAMEAKLIRRIRIWLSAFITGLVLSGITAFPLVTELGWLTNTVHSNLLLPLATATHLLPWIDRVNQALIATNAAYPFLAYGTDWLAFGHLVIAAAFIGPWIDPVRNKWFITFGLIACAGVIPLALIAGPIRNIPFGWRLIDCSFGFVGCIPLLLIHRDITKLERTMTKSPSRSRA